MASSLRGLVIESGQDEYDGTQIYINADDTHQPEFSVGILGHGLVPEENLADFKMNSCILKEQTLQTGTTHYLYLSDDANKIKTISNRTALTRMVSSCLA